MILGRVMLDGRFGVQLDDLCDDDLSHHPDAGLAKKWTFRKIFLRFGSSGIL